VKGKEKEGGARLLLPLPTIAELHLLAEPVLQILLGGGGDLLTTISTSDFPSSIYT
jgi:hypothetical protein